MSKPKQARNERLDIYSALAVSHANIEGCLRQLKQPINQSKQAQERIIGDLTKSLTELYNNVKISIRANTIKEDPTGILNNETIYSTLTRTKEEFPHWHLVPAIIQSLINSDEDPIMRKNTTKKAASAPVVTQTSPQQLVQESPIVEDTKTVSPLSEDTINVVDGLSELDTLPENTKQDEIEEMIHEHNPNQVEIKPEVQTQVTATAQAIATHTVTTVTETVVIPADINDTFHVPYMVDIEKILLQMNDAFDNDELVNLRSNLGIKVREWADAFYKSLHDLENPQRVTIDKVGLLTSTTKYSSPELHAKFDNAHMVDKILAKVNEKYKKTNTEASVHAMATAISGAQDETKTTFEVPTGNGESIVVNKETEDITAKKDGKIVGFFKGIYKGIKKFFSNIWKQMKRFGAWIKSWFVKDESEKRIDATPEEAKQMEIQAKATAAAIAATGQVATPVVAVIS